MRHSLLVALALTCSGLAADFYEPKPGTSERTAIMNAMRGPVSLHVGKRVTFTGSVRISGAWASFQGNVAPTDGKVPKTDAAADMELDFFALLRREGESWRVLHWGFAGDIAVAETAREKFPKAPKALFSYLDQPQ